MRVGAKQRGLAFARDLLLETTAGRCPKDGGCLEYVGEDGMVDARCINCGWRRFTVAGKLVAAISKERAEADLAEAQIRLANMAKGREARREATEWGT